MINNIYIENFKTFKTIEFSNLKKINLVSGKNNVGKSTLLEALFLFMGHTLNDSFTKLGVLRGTLANGVGLWEPLFFQMNSLNSIQIALTEDGKESKLVYERDDNYLPNNVAGISEEILAQFRSSTKDAYSLSFLFQQGDYSEEGHFSISSGSILREMKTSLPGNEVLKTKHTIFINDTYARNLDVLLTGLGLLELSDEKALLIKYIQEMDPSIEDIITLSLSGIPQLYIRTGGRMIPLQYAGDGIMKLISICLAIMEQKNGLVLIDEMENGFHYSMYGKLWAMIDRISEKSNCQVIATTHSYELIASAFGNIKDTDNFSYYRLGRKENDITTYRYDYSMLDKAIEAEMEVR